VKRARQHHTKYPPFVPRNILARADERIAAAKARLDARIEWHIHYILARQVVEDYMTGRIA
jgi:hypothetical protein